MSNSDSAPETNSLKSLLLKGLVGTVALVGTTAIPIVVQRSLQAPPASPADSAATVPVAPAQISPLPDSSQVNSATTLPVVDEDAKGDSSNEKGKKKRGDD
ncbi:hypothetical protein H6F75_04150 [Nodosilinea sp. FACHB-131]|uniref:hypothetical protein n=1 Tax=Cyanophyceae TaxID=3028117 RepID=UPI00168994FE|nr:hypothetical protein [Nodosilinea sp. FACHB-131]MBD1872663.1 hypothetical protein [Nodosilinea sp. FACHB-131]